MNLPTYICAIITNKHKYTTTDTTATLCAYFIRFLFFDIFNLMNGFVILLKSVTILNVSFVNLLAVP